MEDDLRTFIREQTLRMEATSRQVGDALERMGARMDALTAQIEDQGDQLRANTAATWQMVDEIRGRGA